MAHTRYAANYVIVDSSKTIVSERQLQTDLDCQLKNEKLKILLKSIEFAIKTIYFYTLLVKKNYK